jgi:hypothetical protein
MGSIDFQTGLHQEWLGMELGGLMGDEISYMTNLRVKVINYTDTRFAYSISRKHSTSNSI